MDSMPPLQPYPEETSSTPPTLPLTTTAGLSDVQSPGSSISSVLQQLQAMYQQPAMPNDPLAQIGAMAQGFASGMQGKPNPALEYWQKRKQEGMARALPMVSLGLSMDKENRALAEQTAKRKLEVQKHEMDLYKAGVADTNPGIREQAYERGKTLVDANGVPLVPKTADAKRLALLGKDSYDTLKKEAARLIALGLDPEIAAFNGRFSSVPVAEYKAAFRKDPVTAYHTLVGGTMDDALKAAQYTLARIDPAKLTPEQRQQFLAIEQVRHPPVNYGEETNRWLKSEFNIDPRQATQKQVAEVNVIIEANRQQRNPTFFRELSARADENSLTGDERIKFLRENLAEAAGAKQAAVVGATPPPAETQKDLQAFSNHLMSIEELKSFTPAELDKYTGIMKNPARYAVEIARSNDPTGLLGKPDERFLQFRALMGYFQRGYFEQGGKQLTPFEAKVARMSTPTGMEPGGAAELLAKVKYMEAFTRISRDARTVLATVGKGELAKDPAMLERLVHKGMEDAGLKEPTPANPTPWLARKATAPTAPKGFRPVSP